MNAELKYVAVKRSGNSPSPREMVSILTPIAADLKFKWKIRRTNCECHWTGAVWWFKSARSLKCRTVPLVRVQLLHDQLDPSGWCTVHCSDITKRQPNLLATQQNNLAAHWHIPWFLFVKCPIFNCFATPRRRLRDDRCRKSIFKFSNFKVHLKI